MSLVRDAHQTALALGLADLRAAVANCWMYASARTPGHSGFTFEEEPTPAGLDKMRPDFRCCFEHGEACRPSGPVVDCKLADALREATGPSTPALVCGVDFGMSARVGPAWFVREWLPGLRLVKAVQ